MAKIQNKPHLTNFIKQNYIWILMIVTMSCIHLLYMYLIGARKQDLVYAAVLDAILLLITVLVGFFRYSSKVKALSNALKRPVEEQAQLQEATDDVEMLYHRLLENQSIARSESESSAAIRQSQMRDYYSMWVHQIKTPISAMKLLLEAEREELGQLICDDEQSQCHIGDMTGGNIGAAGLNAALKQQAALTEMSDNMDSFEDELFRIEEYVSMALQYQRVSSTENDFVLEKRGTGLPVLPAEGNGSEKHSAGLLERDPQQSRLSGDFHPDHAEPSALGDLRSLGSLQREHVHHRHR